jgi:hypothetical protein
MLAEEVIKYRKNLSISAEFDIKLTATPPQVAPPCLETTASEPHGTRIAVDRTVVTKDCYSRCSEVSPQAASQLHHPP